MALIPRETRSPQPRPYHSVCRQRRPAALSPPPRSQSCWQRVPDTATAVAPVGIAASQAWSATLFPANQKSSWLVIYPQSGSGPGSINLVASAAGLANGVYTATVVLQ